MTDRRFQSTALTDPARVSEALQQLSNALRGTSATDNLTLFINVYNQSAADGTKKVLNNDVRRRGVWIKNRLSSPYSLYVSTVGSGTSGVEIMPGFAWAFIGTNEIYVYTDDSTFELVTVGV